MSDLVVFWDDAFLAHRPPAGAYTFPSIDQLPLDEPHPDRPGRVENIRGLLAETLTSEERSVTPASRDQLEAVHDPAYLRRLESAVSDGPTRLTSTTVAVPGTYRAAVHAAGAAIGVGELALATGIETVPYAPVRPSGHHAQSDRADGYCFVNNVAVAAAHLKRTDRADRVAVLDWDVHHGNGTQEIFEDRDDVLVISVHGDHGAWSETSHPQSGRLDECGVGAGEGYTVNVPLPLGTGDRGYEFAFDRVVEPVIAEYSPDVLLVSAGQDAAAYDPVGRNVVSSGGFHRFGERARRLATEHADGHLGLVQEGGYQLTYLAFDTLAVLAGATGREIALEDSPIQPTEQGTQWPVTNDDLARERIREAIDRYSDWWPLRE